MYPLRRIRRHARSAQLGSGRPIAFRRRQPQREAEDRRGFAERPGHVRPAVADEDDGLARDLAELFLDGKEIGEDLHRVSAVGKAVDHRHRRSGSECLQPLVAVRAEHDRVDIARRHARRVLQRLAARDLALLHRQRDRVPAELADGRLERDAGPGRSLFEQQQQRPPLERPLPAVRLQLVCAAEEQQMLVGREIGQGQEIALHRAASLSSRNN